MASELMSRKVFENRVKHIISALFMDRKTFEVVSIIRELSAHPYNITCKYGEVVDVLEKLRVEKKLIAVVFGQSYKVAPANL